MKIRFLKEFDEKINGLKNNIKKYINVFEDIKRIKRSGIEDLYSYQEFLRKEENMREIIINQLNKFREDFIF